MHKCKCLVRTLKCTKTQNSQNRRQQTNATYMYCMIHQNNVQICSVQCACIDINANAGTNTLTNVHTNTRKCPSLHSLTLSAPLNFYTCEYTLIHIVTVLCFTPYGTQTCAVS